MIYSALNRHFSDQDSYEKREKIEKRVFEVSKLLFPIASDIKSDNDNKYILDNIQKIKSALTDIKTGYNEVINQMRDEINEHRSLLNKLQDRVGTIDVREDKTNNAPNIYENKTNNIHKDINKNNENVRSNDGVNKKDKADLVSVKDNDKVSVKDDNKVSVKDDNKVNINNFNNSFIAINSSSGAASLSSTILPSLDLSVDQSFKVTIDANNSNPSLADNTNSSITNNINSDFAINKDTLSMRTPSSSSIAIPSMSSDEFVDEFVTVTVSNGIIKSTVKHLFSSNDGAKTLDQELCPTSGQELMDQECETDSLSQETNIHDGINLSDIIDYKYLDKVINHKPWTGNARDK